MTQEPKYGHIIRTARKACHITQETLAKKAGIAVNSLRRYESDLRCPSIDVLEKIAAALGLTLGEFLFPANHSCPSAAAEDWFTDITEKLRMIGFTAHYDETHTAIWLRDPQGRQHTVSADTLQAIHAASNAFLRLQLAELNPAGDR